jgi:hypothetical protein
MLQHISVDTVGRVAELAKAALDEQDAVLNKMNKVDVGEADRQSGDLNPEALDNLTWLDLTTSGARFHALRDFVAGLTPEELQELHAIMLIGRGDHAAGDWDAAMTEAAGYSMEGQVDRIIEKTLLHDYLTKGLYELKLR